MRYWTIVACIVLFLPNYLLSRIGWDMFARTGAAWVKFHPATYLLAIAAVLPVATLQRDALAVMRSARFRSYALAATLLTIWSIASTGGASGGGEMSAAVVTFVTPALLLLALTALRDADARPFGRFLHLVLIVNSLTALVEYATHTQLVSLADGIPLEGRSYGLFGHPLASAAMCGMVLVRLIIAGDDRRRPITRVAEGVLHCLALLTFGGRGALICVPVAVVLTMLIGSWRRDAGRIGFMQRLGVFVILLLGGVFLTLPLDIVQAFLGRFGEDAGSAGTRYAAFTILSSLSWKALWFGSNEATREFYRVAFNTETAVEVSWINLILSYGLIATTMISAAMIALFFRLTRGLDLSAWAMVTYFFLVESTSLGFGTKSVAIAQAMLVVLVLCPAPVRTRRRRPAAGNVTFPAPAELATGAAR